MINKFLLLLAFLTFFSSLNVKGGLLYDDVPGNHRPPCMGSCCWSDGFLTVYYLCNWKVIHATANCRKVCNCSSYDGYQLRCEVDCDSPRQKISDYACIHKPEGIGGEGSSQCTGEGFQSEQDLICSIGQMICRELSIGECQGCTEAYYIDCNCHIEFGY